LPESRWHLPFGPASPRLSRFAAHVSVLAILVASTVIGLGGTGRSTGATADSHRDSFGFVSAVRGAAESAAPLDSAHFEIAADPLRSDLLLDRRARPTPMPRPLATPVPPPAATPEPARRVAATLAAPLVGNGWLAWPVVGGQISQYFHAGHTALDIAAHAGSSVIAAQAGVVVSAGWRNNGGGWVVQIDHGNGIQTLYNHLGKILVGVGQQVGRGDLIAFVGCTGNCTGPHVHFEVNVHGVDVNPLRYL
jgi:murein DD-endopeptidase MepM/ murein hydrolase activator NlpD